MISLLNNSIHTRMKAHNSTFATSNVSHLKQLSCDRVCFSGNPYAKMEKAILNKGFLDEAVIKDIKTIQIIDKQTNKPIQAYMTKLDGKYSPNTMYAKDNLPVNTLAVFSKDGDVLGVIKNMDATQWIKDDEFKNVGKYLRLNRIINYKPKEYKGVGSALIDEMVEQSKKMGLGGQIRALALNDMDPYRFCPIPFYAKKGFIDFDAPFATKEQLVDSYEGSVNSDEWADMFLLHPETLKKVQDDFLKNNNF